MGSQAQELQPQIHDSAKEADPPENANTNGSGQQSTATLPRPSNLWWWIRMAIYAVFVLTGQSVGVLLGRLYYDKGGKSKRMATLVQPAGFLVLLPFLLIPAPNKAKNQSRPNANKEGPSILTLVSLYSFFGIFVAATCMMYSIGLLYLPVSTYSLICSSQLGFNAFFSYFLNSQKLTPFIINSLFLLTTSSVLLIFSTDSSHSNDVPKGKYAIGFVCTLGASAGYGLLLSVAQLSFRRILKKENFRVVLDMCVYPSLVATLAVLVGLFASGEWKGLGEEMSGFRLGKASYVMTLVWTAISWQVFNIGAVGLILEVSSLFSNVISTLGLPVVPVLAVFIFGDKMDGVKVISMVLAIWGFVSYVYQHYLDDDLKSSKCKAGSDQTVNQVSRHQLSHFERSA